ncbi:hypothetical protein J4E05_20855 [Thalassospira sp. NFXS8]
MTQNNSIRAGHLPPPVFSRFNDDETAQVSTSLPTPLLSRISDVEALAVLSGPVPNPNTMCLGPCMNIKDEKLTVAAPVRPTFCWTNAEETLSASGPRPPISACRSISDDQNLSAWPVPSGCACGISEQAPQF